MALDMCARHNQRGVAALEFALVVPLFLMLMGGTIYFGIALFAKMVITNAAHVAVRSCVSKQIGFRNEGDFINCAEQQMAYLTANDGTFNSLCMNGSGSAKASIVSAATGAIAQDIRLLQLTVPCNIAVNPMINGVQGSGGSNITQFNMRIMSSMPFTVYKPSP
jgi:Flp pilus assembly protein TadG